MFVLNFGGQLVHLDMATWNLTGSRSRPGFESGRPSTPNDPSVYLQISDLFLALFSTSNKRCPAGDWQQ